jgi:DNA-binding MarR family transcriptional regulator
VSTPAGHLPERALPERADIVAKLERSLRETSGQSVLFSQAVADRAGMNPTDLETLEILARHGASTAGRLAELTGLTTGAITGLVDRLERRGYVRRERHPTDRRSVIIQPDIENAWRDLSPSYAAMSRAMTDLMDHYSDDELAIIADFMTRAAAVTADQIARLRAESSKKPAPESPAHARGRADEKPR